MTQADIISDNVASEVGKANEAALRVENLKTHFFTKAGVVKSVDGVSFDLERGEILGDPNDREVKQQAMAASQRLSRAAS